MSIVTDNTLPAGWTINREELSKTNSVRVALRNAHSGSKPFRWVAISQEPNGEWVITQAMSPGKHTSEEATAIAALLLAAADIATELNSSAATAASHC